VQEIPNVIKQTDMGIIYFKTKSNLLASNHQNPAQRVV
jgi:hypothetical protein